MITSDALRLAAQGATTELHRLCTLVALSAQALATAEQRAEKAEAALSRAKKRQAQLKAAPADLAATARALLDKIDTITTEQFASGAERPAREALRTVLEVIEASDV
jgi:hypothetical protein